MKTNYIFTKTIPIFNFKLGKFTLYCMKIVEESNDPKLIVDYIQDSLKNNKSNHLKGK